MKVVQRWNEKLEKKKEEIRPVSMKCQKCSNEDFKTIKEFDQHTGQCYKNEFLDKTVIFKCKICNSIWSTAEVLHYHLYKEHESGAVVCNICGQILTNSGMET